eukprot:6213477-Pleurochrysis_carterae.AAC.5
MTEFPVATASVHAELFSVATVRAELSTKPAHRSPCELQSATASAPQTRQTRCASPALCAVRLPSRLCNGQP